MHIYLNYQIQRQRDIDVLKANFLKYCVAIKWKESKQRLSDIDIWVKLLFGTESEKKTCCFSEWVAKNREDDKLKAREWC